MKNFYKNNTLDAVESQNLALKIAMSPFVFQAVRIMFKRGVLQCLFESEKGLTTQEVAQNTGFSKYSAQCLLESGLGFEITLFEDGIWNLGNTGWWFLSNKMIQVNMDFTHDVCYEGLFHLEEALDRGEPAGLKVFGDWPTVYEGLSSLPEHVQKSWFGFDHFYSDNAFPEVLKVLFRKPVGKLLDIGGNTGKWAKKCVSFDKNVNVTIMDLPQQCQTAKEQLSEFEERERIHFHPANVLDPNTQFPQGFDIIWMSQFLDCFSEEEVISILKRAAASMTEGSRVYILETYWDRQKYDGAAMSLHQTSLYFTAIANGNSKMYFTEDMIQCIESAGLRLVHEVDNIGLGHTLFGCELGR